MMADVRALLERLRNSGDDEAADYIVFGLSEYGRVTRERDAMAEAMRKARDLAEDPDTNPHIWLTLDAALTPKASADEQEIG